MSSVLNVYAISADKLQAAVGSADRELVDRVVAQFDWVFEQIDANIREAVEDEEDEYKDDTMSCAAALEQIVFGRPRCAIRVYGDMYGYAYEGLCAVLGRKVGEWSSISRSAEFLDELEQASQPAGFGLSPLKLAFRGTLIEIPPTNGSPCLGYWTTEEIAAALPQLTTWTPPDEMDADIADALGDLRTWARSAEPGNALVGVLS